MNRFRDVAQSFVNVDWELDKEFRKRAEEIVEVSGLANGDHQRFLIYETLRVGAVMFKELELTRAHEEARQKADAL